MNETLRWLLDLKVIPADAEGIRLAFERPLERWVWALLIIGAGLFAVWSYTHLVGRRSGRGVLAITRFALIWLVLFLISGPMLELPRESIERDWVFVLADRSQSMTVADAGSPTQRQPRDAQLGHVISDNAAMWNELSDKRHVVWLGFHDGTFELQTSKSPNVEKSKEERPSDLDVSLGEADGERTSLGTSLEQVLQRGAARPVSGIILLSDGRTDDPPTRAVVRRLQAEGIHVFAVPLGSPDPLGDLAVRAVEAPRRAFVRDKVPVLVELDRLGEAARGLGATIRLVDEFSGETLDELEIHPGDARESVTLTAKPRLAGEATWKVIIEPAEPDLIADNNVKPFAIELVDRPLRVLFVEGYPRWEYRYVKNLLVREETIESSVFLISAASDFAQEGNQPITRLPRSSEEFADYDMIIIGDVRGGFFSPVQLEMIRDHVSQRGAGLLWIAGEHSTPDSYTGTVLADLLPIRGSLNLAPIGAPVTVQPTDIARRLGILQLVTGASADDIGWPRELADPATGWSRLFWAQRLEPGRLKPTAQVLAETVQQFNGVHLPLVVHMRYGSGQTIYVATDEIWRWRFGRGELLPEQFWVQMIRMLGRETLALTGKPAVLTADPRRVAVHQPIRIVLRVLDAQLAQQSPGGRESVTAVLESADGRPIAEITLRRVDGTEDQFAATYLPAETGELRLRIDDPDLRLFNLESNVEVFRPDDEMRRPETDHALLRNLATETGGDIVVPEQVSTIAARLPNRSVTTVNPLTESIWDTPLALALLFGLLTLEWIGRKLIRLT